MRDEDHIMAALVELLHRLDGVIVLQAMAVAQPLKGLQLTVGDKVGRRHEGHEEAQLGEVVDCVSDSPHLRHVQGARLLLGVSHKEGDENRAEGEEAERHAKNDGQWQPGRRDGVIRVWSAQQAATGADDGAARQLVRIANAALVADEFEAVRVACLAIVQIVAVLASRRIADGGGGVDEHSRVRQPFGRDDSCDACGICLETRRLASLVATKAIEGDVSVVGARDHLAGGQARPHALIVIGRLQRLRAARRRARAEYIRHHLRDD
mmetsp:Transcript_9083/g.28758  ORF Transcript_9083/g.28758 Transcript_9083/m.28758 type:complete len:266 (-) Transcript_9083:1629-2426(-)